MSPSDRSCNISVQMLGSLQVRRGNVLLDAQQLGGPKPRQVMEILLLRLGIPVSKDSIIELIWGHHPPPGAVNTLESYVCVLRRNLQPGRAKTGPLQTTTGGYLMDRSQVDLDLDAFNALLASAEKAATAGESYPLVCAALELSAEPLLGDELLPEWAENERRFHDARLTSARILAAETAAALSRPDAAIRWADAALTGDPLNERAWTILVLALEQDNRSAEALRAYERCRQMLKRELGCGPGPVLLGAYARLLRDTAGSGVGLADVFSALATVNDQLGAQARGLADFAPRGPTPRLHESVQEAVRAVDAYLRWALAAT